MRTLLIIVAGVAVLVLVGWVSWSQSPGRASINLETGQIKEDTRSMIRSGADALDEAKQKLDGSDETKSEGAEEPNGSDEPSASSSSPAAPQFQPSRQRSESASSPTYDDSSTIYM